MEKLFNQEAAYEKWDRKNKIKGKDNYFEEDHVSYLKGLKGRIQNNLSGFLRIALTALIVLLQCLFIIFLPFFLQSLTVYFYFIWEITSVIVIVTMVNRNQKPFLQDGMDIYSNTSAYKWFYYVLSVGTGKW